MHASASVNLCNIRICLIALAFLCFSPVQASEFAARIKRAEFEKYQEQYRLNADIDCRLSPTATEAIQSSIPLSWRLQVKIRKAGHFWNSEIFAGEYIFKIRYHALLDSYSVSNLETNTVRHFISLSAALDALSKIRDLPVIKTPLLKKHGTYTAGIRLQLDKESLPLPLRPVAYLYSDWDLSSDWYLWNLQP